MLHLRPYHPTNSSHSCYALPTTAQAKDGRVINQQKTISAIIIAESAQSGITHYYVVKSDSTNIPVGNEALSKAWIATKDEAACWLDTWQELKRNNPDWEHQSTMIIKRWNESQSEYKGEISSDQREDGLRPDKVGRVGEPSSWRIWLLCRGRRGRNTNMNRDFWLEESSIVDKLKSWIWG